MVRDDRAQEKFLAGNPQLPAPLISFYKSLKKGVAQADGRGLLAPVVTSLAALLIYLGTTAPDLTWAYDSADGGELITAAVTLGVPHPPGYPVYVIVGNLVGRIPIGTVAFRFHLLSATCMAVSAGVLSGIVARVMGRRVIFYRQLDGDNALPGRMTLLAPPIAAGLTFALLPLVWQQAIVAEVYSLNMLFVSLLLWLLLTQGRSARSFLVGLLLGLSTSAHLTSLLLLLPSILIVGLKDWRRLTSGLLVGLLPFLSLALLARGSSPIVWGAPASLSGWWWLVSAQLYHPNILALAPAMWATRLLNWLSLPTLWVAAALSMIVLWRWKNTRDMVENGSSTILGVAALYLLYGFTYDAEDAQVLLLPALAILCVLAAVSMIRPSRAVLLLPLILMLINFQRMDLSQRTTARDIAYAALQEIPRDAIVLTSGDRATFSLWYLQFVTGQREDIAIVDGDLLAFAWYRSRLSHTYPALLGLEFDDVGRFRRLNQSSQPLCRLRFGAAAIEYLSCIEEPT